MACARFSVVFGRFTGTVVFACSVLVLVCSAKSANVVPVHEQVVGAAALTDEGDAAFLQGDHYRALIKYLEAERIHPDSPYVQNKLGLAYAQLKFFDHAEKAFERAIALHSRFAIAHNNLGSLHLAKGQKRKAEQRFRTAIQLNPKIASFHRNLAAVCFETGKSAEGLALWKKALSLDPDFMSGSARVAVDVATDQPPMVTYYYLARLYASVGDAERSLGKLKEALDCGFCDLDSLRREPDFEPIRNDPRFQSIVRAVHMLKR
jgi:tetratricopeptide (TPR) repeat protein